jgi:hypothetical protein
MKTKQISKGFAVVPILIGVVVLIGLGGLGYYFVSNRLGIIKDSEGNIIRYKTDGEQVHLKDESGGEMVGGKNIKLPASFPKNVPVYSNLKLTVATTEGDSSMYQGSTKDEASKVLSWYKKELTKLGWQLDTSDDISVNLSNQTHAVGVNVLPTNDGVNNVMVLYMDKAANDLPDSNTLEDMNQESEAIKKQMEADGIEIPIFE